MNTEIGKTGEVIVEGHPIGRLDGFTFAPGAAEAGSDAKALQAAAQKALAGEIDARAEKLGAAPDESIVLASDGTVRWTGDAVAKLMAADDALHPRLRIIADERLAGASREKVQARLDLWLKTHVEKLLGPLFELSKAEDITGIARGIAFQLVEALGVLERTRIAAEMKDLDQASRAALRKYGVRFGAYHIYFPGLLKPAARSLASLLWAEKQDNADLSALSGAQHMASSGRTSFPVDKALPRDAYRVLGYRQCGERAVRVDILERLADLIRPALAWRENTPGAKPPGAFDGRGFVVTQAMTSLTGSAGEDFASVLRALGYRMDRRAPLPPKPAPVETPAAEAAPSDAMDAVAAEVSDAAPSDVVAEVVAEAASEPAAEIIAQDNSVSQNTVSQTTVSPGGFSQDNVAPGTVVQEAVVQESVTQESVTQESVTQETAAQPVSGDPAPSSALLADVTPFAAPSAEAPVVATQPEAPVPAVETPVAEAAPEPAVSDAASETPEASSAAVDVTEAASSETASSEAPSSETVSPEAAPADTTASAESVAAAEPQLVEVWRPGGRADEQRRPRHDRNNNRHRHQQAPQAGAPAVAAGEAGEGNKPERHRQGRRDRNKDFKDFRRPPRDGAPAEATATATAAPADGAPAPERRDDRPRERFDAKGKDRDKDRGRNNKFGGDRNKGDRGGRDKGGGRDKRDGGPSHRPFASSAAPRERDRPIDPNSPFAKLAALKEQLAANRKD